MTPRVRSCQDDTSGMSKAACVHRKFLNRSPNSRELGAAFSGTPWAHASHSHLHEGVTGECRREESRQFLGILTACKMAHSHEMCPVGIGQRALKWTVHCSSIERRLDP